MFVMVNVFLFNLNDWSDILFYWMCNCVIIDVFESGFFFKLLVVLMVLEFGEVIFDFIVDINSGWMCLGGSLVKDFWNYGELILEEII